MAKKTDRYGGRGRPWHPKFIAYMQFIVDHPVYEGMPDAYYEPGRIQWESPSNRASGQFKDTHGKRLRWWAQKAKSIGISTSSDKWISRVAKTIHPTKKKPCKICGRELELRYVYPQERFLNKVRALPFVENDFVLDRLEPISSLVRRLVAEYGNDVLAQLPSLFETSQISIPDPPPKTLKAWLAWIDKVYVPSEPKMMSPGAMSNAPDRFDGFHCDNLCCRGEADKGRHKDNLKSYVTDRRVFEYWTSGDWVAADRLMGVLRSEYPEEKCRHGHPGPCAVDHIGPISLGFTHRPRFQLLCSACNSAKNNRMCKSDVELLLRDERDGDQVISWHSKSLWDECKGRVSNDEQARRLSKLLRDNRHSLMHALQQVARAGAFTYLSTLLDLDRADFDVEFEGLQIKNHLTVFARLKRTPRTTKYAAEQKARRCRVAFAELFTYFKKSNRNSYVVSSAKSDAALKKVLDELKIACEATRNLDVRIKKAATLKSSTEADSAFRKLLPAIAKVSVTTFAKAQAAFQEYMDLIGKELAAKWEDERYVRELQEDEV